MAIEKIINFSLEVLAPADLFCEIAPLAQGIRQGRVALYTLTIRSLNEFAGAVDIVLSGLPVAQSYAATLASGGEVAVPISIDTAALAAQPYALVLTVVGTEV